MYYLFGYSHSAFANLYFKTKKDMPEMTFLAGTSLYLDWNLDYCNYLGGYTGATVAICGLVISGLVSALHSNYKDDLIEFIYAFFYLLAS